MLKGKQGRFRQNLLGKRVDYSGRSVIVVGPDLKLHQCGLPKKMALELFKPFVMRQLVEKGLAHNIKSAKRLVERVRPGRLGRPRGGHHRPPGAPQPRPDAPPPGHPGVHAGPRRGLGHPDPPARLHRVQRRLRRRPDGGPRAALDRRPGRGADDACSRPPTSSRPADGSPVVSPTQDMVLGLLLPDHGRARHRGTRRRRGSSRTRTRRSWPTSSRTVDPPRAGRGDARARGTRRATSSSSSVWSPRSGGSSSTRSCRTACASPTRSSSGPTCAASSTAATAPWADRDRPPRGRHQAGRLRVRDARRHDDRRRRHLGPDREAGDARGCRRPGRRRSTASSSAASSPTTSATRRSSTSGRRPRRTCSDKMMENLDPNSPVAMMTASGARGNKGNIGQLGAMRGLMADPSGRIIDVPVRSNFREGMTVLEYFISTHGARKGLADTALRTADSGYLTRRLVDVAQDVITRDEDCGTEEGSWITRAESDEVTMRARGVRAAARRALRGRAGRRSRRRDPVRSRPRSSARSSPGPIEDAGIREVLVRSPLTCEARNGVCRRCYGRNLATGFARRRRARRSASSPPSRSASRARSSRCGRSTPAASRRPAAPTSRPACPRVEELFEARVPKGKAEISHIDGIVEIIRGDTGTQGQGHERRAVRRPAPAPRRGRGRSRQPATSSRRASRSPASPARTARPTDVVAPEKGDPRPRRRASSPSGPRIASSASTRSPTTPRSWSTTARRSRAGDPITDGPINPQEYLDTRGKDAVQRYLVKEVQKVYREPGRHDQRQAHRDHRPADAPQGPHRPAGRHRPAPDRADRPPRLRGEERPRPGRGRRARHGPDRPARRHQGLPEHGELPGRGVLPGDDPRPHRGRHQRRQGPPGRAQGERHHRQAHPRGDRRAGERRRSPRGRPAPAQPRRSPAASCPRSSAATTTRSSRMPSTAERRRRPRALTTALLAAADASGETDEDGGRAVRRGRRRRVQPVPRRRRRPTRARTTATRPGQSSPARRDEDDEEAKD